MRELETKSTDRSWFPGTVPATDGIVALSDDTPYRVVLGCSRNAASTTPSSGAAEDPSKVTAPCRS